MVETIQSAARLFKAGLGVIDLAAVVPHDQEVAHHFWIVAVQNIADSKEVTQRLGHLLLINPNRTGMHPGIDEFNAIGSLTLGDLIFMVRER